MKVVSDASPIISAARAGSLHLLRAVFGELVLPQAAHAEIVVAGAGLPGSEEGALAGWVEVVPLSDPNAALGLPGCLGAGEREAIALAEELGAAVLLDDLAGRVAARRLGLDVMGTAGILKEAKRLGLITEIRPVLDQYRFTGYRIGYDLYRLVLREVGEL